MDPPPLDAAQRSVVEHGSGPLLVLAGPGTGKTTTLVESVAARIARGGDPERILVLTFSRKAAVELRDRMALRIGAARAPQATTFHSFCYALVRAHQDSDLFTEPLRLLSDPSRTSPCASCSPARWTWNGSGCPTCAGPTTCAPA